MDFKLLVYLATLLVFSTSILTNASVLPPNQLHLSNTGKSNITENIFNETIDEFEKIYRPIIKKKGGILKIQRMWSANEVNASAGRFYPLFSITIMGGLARHPSMTQDSLTLALCHEMGHLLGSAPTKKQIPNRWASVEGQADYFATLKCIRKMWSDDDNIQTIDRLEIDPFIKNICLKSFNNLNQEALCIRSAVASFQLAKLMESILQDGPIDFQTPDLAIVPETLSDHPGSQCRLDTFLQGSLCEMDYQVELSTSNPQKGTCNRSTNHLLGNRPLCWYKPN